ncbi:argininosuccinate lyase [Bacillus chungangensis]|uniref:argininosuccinate lyase n=1 Tax=Bacillus chungangensis TaxID=587633 RepID=A0ABT9WNT3_9BACI|nr:lyase family protein [Bacillus chungangensis]MDQ0174938.1 argininosuccinate lyase [Bacillus chungangensis]
MTKGQMILTGRIQENPNSLLHDEILAPQFSYELKHLFSHYIWIEKVLLLEYNRLGIMKKESLLEITEILNAITQSNISANPEKNMSDISFAIERYVEERLTDKAATWHVDRSRNDFQATAQLMFGREKILELSQGLVNLWSSLHHLAENTLSIPMPGYTHYQPAQMITPGFYLSALSDRIQKLLNRLFHHYEEINSCPFGSGAMAGLELEWDRKTIAQLLGFHQPQAHALVSVASREWVLQIASELSNFGVLLSRFVTDLILWGSSEHRLIDLPDSLSGISSAMPQKKNFPILERIRGKTSHLSALYQDFVLGQRNTAFTNLVETSKEASTHLITMFETTKTIIKLMTVVVENLKFQENRMTELCEQEYFGGFSLANFLCLEENIPYRVSQVITGQYILGVANKGLKPTQVDVQTLEEICKEQGFVISISEECLQKAFSVRQNLYGKQTLGSTNPTEVEKMLQEQKTQMKKITLEWNEEHERVTSSKQKVQLLLTQIGGE